MAGKEISLFLPAIFCFMRKTLLFVGACMLSILPVQAQLDPSFGTDGKVITNIGNATFNAIVQELQPDGKLLIAGDIFRGAGKNKAFLCRVNTDGTLDTTFSGGKIINEFAVSCTAIALQPDGKIITGGNFDGEMSLARYNSDGTIDTTFANGGYLYTPGSSPNKNLYDLILQPDGKIVVLTSYLTSTYRIIRLDANGNPDETFGTGGWISAQVGTGYNTPVNIVLQTDGKLLVGGYIPGSNYFVARHNSNGTSDTTFNGTGTRLITHTYTSNLYGIAVQTDGKIVYNGRATGPEVLVTGRLNADGTNDTSFGNGGSVLTPLYTENSANMGKVKILPDGKIFALNRLCYANGTQDIFMIRYNNNGTTDTSFDTDGSKIFDYGSGNDFGRDFDIIGNKIWISGNTDMSFYENNIAMARFNTDGTPDNTLSTDGKAFLNFIFDSEDEAYAIAVQPDNKIVVGGTTYSNTKDYQSIVRYLPNGAIDTAFGNGGKIIINKPGTARSVVIQPDGKILVAGDDNVYIGVTRLNVDGTLDSTFNDNELHDSANEFGWMLTDMQLLPDGKILIAGRNFFPVPSQDYNYFIARLNANGTVDTTFGTNGYSSEGSVTGMFELITALKVLPDGSILAGGQLWGAPTQFPTHFSLLKYTADGALDTSFANNGIYDGVLTEGNGAIVSIDLQSDGKIVAGIEDYFYSSHYGFILARFNSNGTLDTTFGNNGFVETNTEDYARLTDVKILPDQKIIATGNSYGTTSNFAVAKYNSNGTPDLTFAPEGLLIADFNNTFEVMFAAAFTADNRVLGCGRIYQAELGTHDFALAKFRTDGTLGLANHLQASTGFYPNPANDKVIFTNDVASARLHTIEGRTVKNLEIMSNEADISHLPQGIYLLHFTTKDGAILTQKLIKQ